MTKTKHQKTLTKRDELCGAAHYIAAQYIYIYNCSWLAFALFLSLQEAVEQTDFGALRPLGCFKEWCCALPLWCACY